MSRAPSRAHSSWRTKLRTSSAPRPSPSRRVGADPPTSCRSTYPRDRVGRHGAHGEAEQRQSGRRLEHLGRLPRIGVDGAEGGREHRRPGHHGEDLGGHAAQEPAERTGDRHDRHGDDGGQQPRRGAAAGVVRAGQGDEADPAEQGADRRVADGDERRRRPVGPGDDVAQHDARRAAPRRRARWRRPAAPGSRCGGRCWAGAAGGRRRRPTGTASSVGTSPQLPRSGPPQVNVATAWPSARSAPASPTARQGRAERAGSRDACRRITPAARAEATPSSGAVTDGRDRRWPEPQDGQDQGDPGEQEVDRPRLAGAAALTGRRSGPAGRRRRRRRPAP